MDKSKNLDADVNQSVVNSNSKNEVDTMGKDMDTKQGTRVGDYFVGLDIGTNSVGWAVTNENYELLKAKGKDMWGSRLFEEGQPAAERRVKRSTGRRYNRRKFRLTLLEELFDDEIKKVDPYFYLRLHESQAHQEDKSKNNNGQYFLFNDKNYTDKDFHKDYPTIYHLRYELMQRPPKDIRELFLAIHHIVKSRGNFLYEGQSFIGSGNLTEAIKNVLKLDFIEDFEGEKNIEVTDTEKYIEELASNIAIILQDNSLSRKDRVSQAKKLFTETKKKAGEALVNIMIGLTGKLSDAFEDLDLGTVLGDTKNRFKFGAKDYTEQRNEYATLLGDKITLIDSCKVVNDILVLHKMKPNGKGFSEHKVDLYKKHHKQLEEIKRLLRAKEYRTIYKRLFIDKPKKSGTAKSVKHCNYVTYINKNPNAAVCSQEDFYKKLNKELGFLPDSDFKSRILKDMDMNEYLPLQKGPENGTVPFQVHLEELEAIIAQASKKFSFLLDTDSDGYSIADKLKKLVDFKIPYYIGPLNPTHKVGKDGYSWVVRKEAGRVTPWNFSDKIDEAASAEAFINNLTNKCTYLRGEDVLPKQSLLYTEFMLLNELNMIRCNNKPIETKTKIQLVETIFKKNAQKITEGRLKGILREFGEYKRAGELVLTGINKEIKTDLKSYRDMEAILGKGFDIVKAEKIIYYVTLFGDAKGILRERLQTDELLKGYLTTKKIKDITNLKYKDWGRLSYKFLHDVKGQKKENDSFMPMNIITAMREQPLTLMELLSSHYTYIDQVKEFNDQFIDESELGLEDGLSYCMVDELWISPAVKRSVWQTLKILREISQIKNELPRKIFVEVARTNKAPKKETSSRKNALLTAYENETEEKEKWKADIDSRNVGEFQSKRLLLYYQQMGRCMYSGRPINSVNDIFTDLYEIDHIYPRSLTKDDSINNLVLVEKKKNKDKQNVYPVFPEWQEKNKELWGKLLKNKLISEEKYARLTRTTPLSNEELANFINRQLVETNQAIKAVTELLRRLLPNTEICYVKAEDVSWFRNKYNFIKWRTLNNQHHGKDAYLNVVVGNVIHEKFTKNPVNYIKKARLRIQKLKERQKNNNTKKNRVYSLYNLTTIFKYAVKANNKIVWRPDTSLNIVKNVMKKNSVLVVRKWEDVKGGFYKETIIKARDVNLAGSRPLKTGSYLKDMAKYGGYTGIATKYGTVAKITKLNRRGKEVNELHIVLVSVIDALKIKTDDDLKCYIKSQIVGCVNVEIVYKHLYRSALIQYNGFLYYLGGKDGARMYLKQAVSLILDDDIVKTLKQAEKYLVIVKDNSEYQPNSKFLNDELLLDCYDSLIAKLKTPIFRKLKGNDVDELFTSDTRHRFTAIETLQTKCEVLMSLVAFMSRDIQKGYEFPGLEVKKRTQPEMSRNLTRVNSFSIFNQSVTGLYEEEVKIIEEKK